MVDEKENPKETAKSLSAEEAIAQIQAAAAKQIAGEITATFTHEGVEIELALPRQKELVSRLAKASLKGVTNLVEEMKVRVKRMEKANPAQKQGQVNQLVQLLSDPEEMSAEKTAEELCAQIVDMRDPKISEEGKPRVTVGWLQKIGLLILDTDADVEVGVNKDLIFQVVFGSPVLMPQIRNWLLDVEGFMAQRTEAELKNSERSQNGSGTPATPPAANAGKKSLSSKAKKTKSLKTKTTKKQKKPSTNGQKSS